MIILTYMQKYEKQTAFKFSAIAV